MYTEVLGVCKRKVGLIIEGLIIEGKMCRSGRDAGEDGLGTGEDVLRIWSGTVI